MSVCSRPRCKNAGQSQCSQCRTIYYCSRECQVASWVTHKALCNKICGKKTREYIEPIFKNGVFNSFVFAILDRFEVYGMNKGYVVCNLERGSIDGVIMYEGDITYIAESHPSMQRGRNLILFKYVIDGNERTFDFLVTPPICSDGHDVMKKAGVNMYAMKLEKNQSPVVRFQCDDALLCELVYPELFEKKRS